jgi:D-lactate dehydrogenase
MFANLKCRFIACRSAGYDYVDLNECNRKSIKVANVPSYSPNSIAEFAVGLTINLARQLPMAFDRTKHGDFKLTPKLLGFEMRGKTVGVFGTGKIGKIVCEIFSAFKMKVIAYDVYQDNDWAAKNSIEYVKDVNEIYEQADIISLHVPLLKDNYHMINAESIAKMKNGVLLVNTSRGALVDTKAVIEAVRTKKIGGLALDVYENEVNVFDKDWYSFETNICKDDDLLRLMGLPNVLITSHQAYFTQEALKEISHTSIDNIIEFIQKDRQQASAGSGQFKLKYELH